jgi:hypothetical protein
MTRPIAFTQGCVRRLMLVKEAADYLHIPVAELERLGIGRVFLGTKVRYDRAAIDRHIDVLAGLASPSPSLEADNNAEVAFERSRPHLRHAPRRP